MSILQAIVLGIVQGLCEFLPVSSSGHLVLLQRIFGIEEGALFFTTMLHVGTLVAVFAAFWPTIWKMIKKPISKYPGYIILATLPTVVVALLAKDFIESSFGGQYLGYGFLLTALILWLTGRLPRGKKGLSEMRPGHAVAMGCMQGVAILPGISRSGSTIAGGLFCGLDRDFAAQFSFLMSIPAILGSVVLEGKDLLTGAAAIQVEWLPVLVGMAFAAVSGYIAIKFMLRLLHKGKLGGFSIYLLVLGALVLCDQYIFHVFF